MKYLPLLLTLLITTNASAGITFQLTPKFEDIKAQYESIRAEKITDEQNTADLLLIENQLYMIAEAIDKGEPIRTLLDDLWAKLDLIKNPLIKDRMSFLKSNIHKLRLDIQFDIDLDQDFIRMAWTYKNILNSVGNSVSSPITVLDSGVIVRHPDVTLQTSSFMNLEGKTTPMEAGYSIISTPINVVEDTLDVKLLGQVKRMSEMYPDTMIMVIDWGCGDGRAIQTLAKQSQRIGIKNVRFVGFSNLYFPRWKFAQNVEFIFDDMRNLHKYLGKKSVAVIFSHFGLYHVSSDAISKHLNELAPYILNEGLVVTNVTERGHDVLADSFPYFIINEYFTEYDKVVRLTRKGVGASVISMSTPARGL